MLASGKSDLQLEVFDLIALFPLSFPLSDQFLTALCLSSVLGSSLTSLHPSGRASLYSLDTSGLASMLTRCNDWPDIGLGPTPGTRAELNFPGVSMAPQSRMVVLRNWNKLIDY